MKLADWLEKSGLSQVELAQQVRCSVSTISYIAAGKRRPSLGLALAIAKATGDKVRMEDLA